MPTVGNDTIVGGALTTDVDGLAGSDLLVVQYGSHIGGLEVRQINFVLSATQDISWVGLMDNQPGGPVYSGYVFGISNVERLDYSGSSTATNHVISGAGQDTLRGGLYSDTLFGGSGGDVIYGGGATDFITVAAGVTIDRLYGGDGRDFIETAGWNDIVDGGGGVDWLRADLRDLTVISSRLEDVIANSNWTGIEEFHLRLTSGNDTIWATDFGSVGWLDGGAGQDTLILNRTGLGAITLIESQNHLVGFEHLVFRGSDFGDAVSGAFGNDTVYGMGGNDTMYGGAGNDFLSGDAGNDTFLNVNLSDTVYGGAGVDTAILDLSASSTGVVLHQGGALTNIYGVENYGGVLTNFDDTFHGGALRVRVVGGGGTDHLVLDYTGAPGIAAVSVSIAANFEYIGLNPHTYGPLIQISGWEILTVTGSSGDDQFIGGAMSDRIYGGAGHDALIGGGGADILRGGSGDDTIVGDAADFLYGEEGDDRFNLSGLGDRVYGGTGFDRVDVSFSEPTQGITVSTRDGANQFYSIENFTGYLTNFADVAIIDTLAFTISAGDGNDLLVLNYSDPTRFLRIDSTGQGAAVMLEVIGVGSGNPMTSTAYDFEMIRLHGTTGDDHFTSQEGDDTLYGNLGNDTIYGSGGNDLISGEAGDDALSGGEGNDSLLGGAGNDLLEGHDGADALYGHAGDDRLWGSGGNDQLISHEGHDTLSGGEGNDLLYSGIGDDLAEGGSGNDMIFGESGADFLIGDTGNDSLFGGAGEDFFVGGQGDDLMFGGAGPDMFVFAGDSVSGRDNIQDFVTAEDTLWISGGMTAAEVSFRIVGAHLIVDWGFGQAVLANMAGQTPTILYDSDFL